MNSYVVPMGPINQSSLYDIEIEKAQESYLFSTNGKRYLDLRSGLWNISLGYNKELYETVNQSFAKILNRGIPFIDIHSYNNEFYERFSKKLLNFINYNESKFNRVFYTNSGSEGTELAIKMSRQIHRDNSKKKIVSFQEGYHGTFFGGMAVSGLDEQITDTYEPKLSGFKFFNSPIDVENLNAIVKYLRDYSDEISAFFIEPIVGSGGTLIIKDEFMNTIIRTCNENDILVVFDEVATGFYRTGTAFKFHDLEYYPDIVILSKSINNGILPFGTVVINDKVEKWLGVSHIEHFSTQNGNILGVVSAFRTLEYYEKYQELILKNIEEIEGIYKSELSRENIEFRGQGAMISIPLPNQSIMMSLIQRLKDFGILTYYYVSPQGECGLTLFPPLLIEVNKFEKSMKIITKVITQHTR